VPRVRLESEGSLVYRHCLKAGLLDNQRGENIVSPEADWGCFGAAGTLHYSTVERSARQYANKRANKRMSEALIQTAKDIWPDAIFAVRAADKPQSFSIRGA
jgi:hypothetical protein